MPHIKKGQTLVSGSHGSSVSIVTALRVGQSGVRFSAKKKKIFVQYPKRPNQVSDPPRLLFIGYRSVSPGVKRQGRESDHSPLSSAEFKNKWSSTSVPPPCILSCHAHGRLYLWYLRIYWRHQMQCGSYVSTSIHDYGTCWPFVLLIMIRGIPVTLSSIQAPPSLVSGEIRIIPATE